MDYPRQTHGTTQGKLMGLTKATWRDYPRQTDGTNQGNLMGLNATTHGEGAKFRSDSVKHRIQREAGLPLKWYFLCRHRGQHLRTTSVARKSDWITRTIMRWGQPKIIRMPALRRIVKKSSHRQRKLGLKPSALFWWALRWTKLSGGVFYLFNPSW